MKSWTRLSDFTFTFHFHAVKEMATHSSVLAWRIPGIGEPGGLLSMGSHRVRRDWSDLAAAAATATATANYLFKIGFKIVFKFWIWIYLQSKNYKIRVYRWKTVFNGIIGFFKRVFTNSYWASTAVQVDIFVVIKLKFWSPYPLPLLSECCFRLYT